MTASHTSPEAGLPAAGAGGLTALLSVSDTTGVADLARRVSGSQGACRLFFQVRAPQARRLARVPLGARDLA